MVCPKLIFLEFYPWYVLLLSAFINYSVSIEIINVCQLSNDALVKIDVCLYLVFVCLQDLGLYHEVLVLVLKSSYFSLLSQKGVHRGSFHDRSFSVSQNPQKKIIIDW